MASKKKYKYIEQETHFKLMRLLDENLLIPLRETACYAGISNVSAHYYVTALSNKRQDQV